MLLAIALAAVALPTPAVALPPGAVDRLGNPALRHSSYVASVAFSPDGKRLASGSNTNWTGGEATVKVWDVATGVAVLSVRQESSGLAWLPDGLRVASAGRGVKVWEVATGRTLFSVRPTGGGTVGVAASPDGKTLASVHSTPARVVLWDVATGQQVRELFPPGEDDPRYSRREACVVAFAPDGKTVAAGVSQLGTVLWDAATGEVRRTVPGAYSSPMYESALSFAADGTLAVRKQEGVALIDPTTGATRRRIDPYRGESTPSRFALSADGKWLAMAWVSGLKVWDVVAGRELRTLDYPGGGWPGGVALSPDGELLAWGGYGNAVLLWEVKTGRRLHPGGHDGYIGLAGFGAAGEVYTRDANGLRVWDVGAGGKRRGEKTKAPDDVVALSPDGRTAVSGGYSTYGMGRLTDVATGRSKGKLDVAERESITSVTFHPDGRRAVTVDGNRTLSLWDTTTGKRLRRFEGHNDPVDAIAITPDGKHMATSGSPRAYIRTPFKGYVPDTGIRVWNLDTGAEVRQIKGVAGTLAYSPDGKMLAVGIDSWERSLKLVNAGTGAVIRELKGPRLGPQRVAFTPDGRTLVSVGRDKAVRLWDVATGTERQRFDGHAGEVYSLTVSADGRRLATSGGDGLVYIWDVPDTP